jgi:hypothetical protein
MSVPVHRIESADSAAAIGLSQSEHWFQGVWWFHSVNLQNEDVAAGEEGQILLQFDTDTYDADHVFHVVEMGNTRRGAPLNIGLGFPARDCLVVGQVDSIGATVHRLTVLAWKIGV